MNYFVFIIKTSFEDFRRNKIRTFLTSLGILIGVSSVVLLLSLGLGLKKFISSQFDALGSNLIYVLPGKVLEAGFRPGGGALGGVEFDQKDVLTLKKIAEAEYVVPVFQKTVEVSAGGNTELGDLFATTSDIFAVRDIQAEYGKLFTERDLEKRSRIVVIGPTIAEDVFGSAESAVGKSLSIEGQKFKIVGVLESLGGGGVGGPDFDAFVYMPHTSAISFNPDRTFITMYVKARTEDDVALVKEKTDRLLQKRYDEGDFSVIEQTEILNVVTSVFSALNTALVFIGAISLIVGGIGIMNIMYVSVVERTKEVGIRRAIGATKQDILAQFLTESILISLIGGLSGIVLSIVAVILINSVFPAVINLPSIIIAFVISTLVGVIFGVFPARKAANLLPIEAIRYE